MKNKNETLPEQIADRKNQPGWQGLGQGQKDKYEIRYPRVIQDINSKLSESEAESLWARFPLNSRVLEHITPECWSEYRVDLFRAMCQEGGHPTTAECNRIFKPYRGRGRWLVGPNSVASILKELYATRNGAVKQQELPLEKKEPYHTRTPHVAPVSITEAVSKLSVPELLRALAELSRVLAEKIECGIAPVPAVKPPVRKATTEQVARAVRCSSTTVLNWAHNGMPCNQRGRLYRFNLQEVRNWIDRHGYKF